MTVIVLLAFERSLILLFVVFGGASRVSGSVVYVQLYFKAVVGLRVGRH